MRFFNNIILIVNNNILSIYLILILILINFVASYYVVRIDLTSDNKYSIGKATNKILSEIDDIIHFKVYLHGDIPLEYKKLENEIKYLLNEFQAYTTLIEYEFIDPTAMENEEYQLSLYKKLYEKGIFDEYINHQTTKQERTLIFPGATVTYQGDDELYISFIDDYTLEISARTTIETLEEKLQLSLKLDTIDEDFDTVGGLIFAMLGRVPDQGEIISHPCGVELKVIDADPRRIKKLLVRHIQKEKR